MADSSLPTALNQRDTFKAKISLYKQENNRKIQILLFDGNRNEILFIHENVWMYLLLYPNIC